MLKWRSKAQSWAEKNHWTFSPLDGLQGSYHASTDLAPSTFRFRLFQLLPKHSFIFVGETMRLQKMSHYNKSFNPKDVLLYLPRSGAWITQWILLLLKNWITYSMFYFHAIFKQWVSEFGPMLSFRIHCQMFKRTAISYKAYKLEKNICGDVVLKFLNTGSKFIWNLVLNSVAKHVTR